MTRIAVLNSHPIQYFAPLYAFLNREPDLEVTALYLSDFSIRGGHDKGFGHSFFWDIDLLSGYPYRFLGDAAKRRQPGGFSSMLAPEVWSAVRQGGYHALWLHGHAHAANLLALAAARSVGMPVLMRCETHLQLTRGKLKRALRSTALRSLYSQCARFLAIGSANHEFYCSLGIPEEKIFRVPYVVDNARFIETSRLSTEERSEVRRSLGVEDDLPVVLYASKLQRHKRPHDLVEACSVLAADGVAFHLVMVGSGEMEQELREMVEMRAVPRTHFSGFVNQSALPRVYGASDVFVLPSEEEPWGLVVNEAMCAGLPIVATTAIGAARDLVERGRNGAIYRAGDAAGLAAALKPILRDERLRRAMSQHSRERITNWGFEQCRDGLRSALEGLSRSG